MNPFTLHAGCVHSLVRGVRCLVMHTECGRGMRTRWQAKRRGLAAAVTVPGA